MNMRLDFYDDIPAGMKSYLSAYGWHFSKAMCEWAISNMTDMNGNRIQMRSKEQIESVLASNGITLKNNRGYDHVFVWHMGLSDYYGSSVPDDRHLARYVKDVIDDVDGYDGIAFTRFIADCSGKGIPIIWEDML